MLRVVKNVIVGDLLHAASCPKQRPPLDLRMTPQSLPWFGNRRGFPAEINTRVKYNISGLGH